MSRARVAVLSALIVGRFASPSPAEEPAGFKIVVNASNPAGALSREEVADLFLKKSTAWPDGRHALPVDQPTSADPRRAFSTEILRQNTNDVAAYWNRAIFSGRGTPPITKPTDAEVMAYLRANPNAVGYVAADAPLVEGVKPLTIKK
jgi:ABC-type phosphate transport system substrate-binding protein